MGDGKRGRHGRRAPPLPVSHLPLLLQSPVSADASRIATAGTNSMIETNPILAQIADLKGRVESLRGYL